jgi:hypothetical protein
MQGILAAINKELAAEIAGVESIRKRQEERREKGAVRGEEDADGVEEGRSEQLPAPRHESGCWDNERQCRKSRNARWFWECRYRAGVGRWAGWVLEEERRTDDASRRGEEGAGGKVEMEQRGNGCFEVSVDPPIFSKDEEVLCGGEACSPAVRNSRIERRGGNEDCRGQEEA